MTALYKFCWALWIGGTALIVASWVDVVSPAVGWVGFVVALIGTLLSFAAHQRPQQQARPKRPGADPDEQPPGA